MPGPPSIDREDSGWRDFPGLFASIMQQFIQEMRPEFGGGIAEGTSVDPQDLSAEIVGLRILG